MDGYLGAFIIVVAIGVIGGKISYHLAMIEYFLSEITAELRKHK